MTRTVNVCGENEQRPLDLTFAKGQQAMIDFLESHGAIWSFAR